MKPISVLIIDDNEADRYLLTRLLNESGIDVRVFEKSDGEDALEFFRDYEQNKLQYPDEYPPLVIFLDINMPRVDGFEFLQGFSNLRQEKDIYSSVIVMFTSSGREDDMKKAFEYDFVRSFLIKGEFTSEQLNDELKKFL